MKYVILLMLIITFFAYFHEDVANTLENIVDSGSYNLDPVLMEARPYTSKVHPITCAGCRFNNCLSNECIIAEVYDYVIRNYNYISDPPGKELIRSPEETMRIGGGDCEDLSILLNSLLEKSLKINNPPYLVLTDTHVYSLVCGIDIKEMERYIKKFLVRNAKKSFGEDKYDVKIINNDMFIIKSKNITRHMGGGSVFYYGGDGKNFDEPIKYLNMKYSIVSDNPVDIYVVPDPEQYERIADRKKFKTYECTMKNVRHYEGECNRLPTNGGIVILSKKDTNINLELEYYYEYEDDSKITYYNINGTNCIVLDPTAGEFGYPGYDNNLTGRKIATDGENYYYLG